MKMITGYLGIGGGDVFIDGKSVSEHGDALKRHIGYLLRRAHARARANTAEALTALGDLFPVQASALAALMNGPLTGDRLSAGQRRHEDLIWLRSMRAALAGGVCSDAGIKFAPLLELALMGASRPVIVYRNVAPVLDHPHHPNFWAKRLN